MYLRAQGPSVWPSPSNYVPILVEIEGDRAYQIEAPRQLRELSHPEDFRFLSKPTGELETCWLPCLVLVEKQFELVLPWGLAFGAGALPITGR